MATIEIPYKPLEDQFWFHTSSADWRLASGGVRSGKTVGGAYEFLAMILEDPGHDYLILAPFYKTLQSVTLRTFKDIVKKIPGYYIKDVRRSGDQYLLLHGGTRVYYRSAENPVSYEGLTIAGLWIDEGRYIKRDAWDVAIARLSAPKAKRLRCIITTTPSMGWLWDEFMTGKPNRSVNRFRTIGNTHLHNGYVENLKASLSPQKYKQYVEGEFVLLEGAVYASFDESVHVIPLEVDPRYPVDVIYDPGIQKSAAIYAQKFDYCSVHGVRDCVHIVDEDMPDGVSTLQQAPRFGERFALNGWIRGTCFTDPAANSRSIQTGLPDVYLIEDNGWHVRYQTDPVARYIPNGVEAVRGKLKSASGQTSLYISDKLKGEGHARGVINAFKMYAYPEEKHGRPTSEHPLKDGTYDHAMDVVRYYVINQCPIEGLQATSLYSRRPD